ncbi:MAG: hypothetical protein ACYTHM_17700 [Planctomycetota bacterium]|jgi:DNA invertase Pin-like site-specific DNA recombinase
MVSLNLLPPTYLTALLVEDVLASYPLNPLRAERIRKMALRRFREKPDLETIYLFIDSLVEGGIQPEDFLFSLKTPDKLPGRTPEPLTLLEEKERGETLTYDEIVAFVQSRVDGPSAGALLYVLERARIHLSSQSPVTGKELEENLETITRRLRQIKERLDRCGVLVPGRPIQRVSFRRKDLFEYRGAYDGKVTDAVAVRIFEAHRNGLSQTEAAAFAGVSRDTVKRWWKNAGLKPHVEAHNALPPERIERILASHETFSGNAARAGKALNVAPSTMIRYWRMAGKSPRGRPGALTADRKEEILEAHDAFAGNAMKAAHALGLSPSTVRKYWKRAGLCPRPPGRPPRAG